MTHCNIKQFQLPGYNLPLDYEPPYSDEKDEVAKVGGSWSSRRVSVKKKLFKHILDCDVESETFDLLPLTTLREITMLQFMNNVTDKPDWHLKVVYLYFLHVNSFLYLLLQLQLPRNLSDIIISFQVFDNFITTKWRSETLSGEIDFTEKMFEWCIAELKFKARLFKNSDGSGTGAVSVFAGEVVKSDVAIPACLRKELLAGVRDLEDVPDNMKDWHPDSDGKVLDLVHPSLFPLVYGRSHILVNAVTNLDDAVQRCGEGTTFWPLEKPGSQPSTHNSAKKTGFEPGYPFSEKFQWLPCDVDISSENAKITSYVNNLHPQMHRALYRTIEKIIDCVIPLWNMTLSQLGFVGTGHIDSRRIRYTECKYDPDPDLFNENEGPQKGPNEDVDEYWERREVWNKETRRVVKPNPGQFVEPFPPDGRSETVDLRKNYGKQGLQVIVKLANIHLTPDKPEYLGGTWHVEGMLNEHICASAIYYYSNVNITSSEIAFRQLSNPEYAHELLYPQNQDDWLEVVYGCTNEESPVQYFGAVETREGRVLTWPNILQHQVQPFKLVDLTKNGHRKILALFLVDPNIKIISTANIPCQRKDWWTEHILKDCSQAQPKGDGKITLADLPVELQDRIFDKVDYFPIGLKEAKEMRLELMEERKSYVVRSAQMFEDNEYVRFSLCEH